MIEETENHIYDEKTGIITIWKITQEIDADRNVLREISRETIGILEMYDTKTLTDKVKELELKVKELVPKEI